MNRILILNEKVYINGLCCPNFGGFNFISRTCCECVYEFNITGSVAAGCGTSTYYPNRCNPLNFKTQDIVIGPFKFDAEIISSGTGILVDDELLVNGLVFQPNFYLVTLGSGGTGVNDPSSPPDCIQFAGGTSLCNGQHTIPQGTVISVLNAGDTLTLAAGDNHGIDLFMRGQIKVLPISTP